MLIVIIMGVTTINNFDKMKSVQTALNNLTSTTSSDKQPVEAKETSGNVTAVTNEPSGEPLQQEAGQKDAQEDTGQKDNEGQAPADSDQPQDTDKGGQDADAAKTDAGVKRKRWRICRGTGRYAGDNKPENIWRCHPCGCDLQNERSDGWKSDLRGAEIAITIK